VCASAVGMVCRCRIPPGKYMRAVSIAMQQLTSIAGKHETLEPGCCAQAKQEVEPAQRPAVEAKEAAAALQMQAASRRQVAGAERQAAASAAEQAEHKVAAAVVPSAACETTCVELAHRHCRCMQGISTVPCSNH